MPTVDANEVRAEGPRASPSRSTFGKYVLLRKLASGGMGEIFLAKQRGPSGFEKLLVIKRILSHHLDKKDYLDMFFSEARLVARLNHPNIIQIIEMGEIDGDHYIAMEYVRGKSLRDIIDELRAEAKSLPVAHVVDLGIKLCEGLGYAHQARDIRGRPMNIVHRDINPHNVLISYTGDLKLIDFGIAKSEMTSVHTATGTIKGKFVYMSPEQSAADPLDKRSDIFSLGIVLYEMLALENPFVRQNVVLSLEAIQRHPLVPPSRRRSDAAALDAVLLRALEKQPEARFQSAIEMRDALRDLVRTGVVPPADLDLSGFLHGLFAADIAEEDRLLAEADKAARRLPPPPTVPVSLTPPPAGELIDAPRRPAAFVDEEPTVAGNPSDFAQRSLEASQVQGWTSDLASPGVPMVRGTAGVNRPVPAPSREALRPAKSRPSWLRDMAYGLAFLLTAAAGFAGTRLLLGDRDSPPPVPMAKPAEIGFEPARTDAASLEAPPRAPPETLPAQPPPIPAPPPAVEPERPAEVETARATAETPRARPKRRPPRRNPPRSAPTAEASPARPAAESVQPAARGRLVLPSAPAMAVIADGQRLGGVRSVVLRRDRGQVQLSGGADVAYTITLDYAVEPGGLKLEVKTTPWSIIYRNDLALGRSPRKVDAAGAHKLRFAHPDHGELHLSLRWTAP